MIRTLLLLRPQKICRPKSCTIEQKKWTDRVELTIKINNMTGSSQVGAISKAQKYSKNNYWKHLEKLFFSKKNLKIFFRKKLFFRSRTMPKNSKRGHSGSLNVFTNRKLQKNARGYPLIESENFRKKSRIVPKKRKKIERKKSFGLASTFGSIKNLWFSARIEPTISGFSEN